MANLTGQQRSLMRRHHPQKTASRQRPERRAQRPRRYLRQEVPRQHDAGTGTKLFLVMVRVFDAAFRLGYHSFKDAARFVLQTIREKIGAEVADAVTIDHL